MLKHSISLIATAGLIAASVNAQAFNVDINVAPSTSPVNTFGGQPGFPGVWNAIAPVNVFQQLSDISGTPDNSDMRLYDSSGQNPGVGFNTGIPAPFTELYEDYATETNNAFFVDVDDMDAGDYVAVLYSYRPGGSTFFRINTTAGTFTGSGIISPLMFPAAGYVPNATYEAIPFTVGTQNETITIDVLTEGTSAFNGVQLIPVIGTTGCQQPTPNSTGTTPDIIATGTSMNGAIVAAANDMVLNIGLLPSILPPNGGILCWVSNFQNVSTPINCPFVGVRCIGNGNLVRVPDPNAGMGSGGAGVVSPLGTYQLAIDLNFLASRGINVAPGSTLFFQFVYRDLPVPMCGANAVIRWTNSVAIPLI